MNSPRELINWAEIDAAMAKARANFDHEQAPAEFFKGATNGYPIGSAMYDSYRAQRLTIIATMRKGHAS